MSGRDFLRRPCPLCGSPAAQAEVRSRPAAETLTFDALRPYWTGLKEKPFFSYHRCGGCGLLFNPAYFSPEQLGALYASMAPNMDAVAEDAIRATQRGYFARAMAAAPPEGGYLEIGPDAGHIVAEAARDPRFDRFWLFEPNLAIHGRLRDAAARPAALLADMDDLSPVPDGSVSLAVMIHVLDHLLDPLAMLAQVRAKLRPGGILLIVTHDESSLLRRALGRPWPPFCLQHPELYNPATIRRLLAGAGFGDVSVEPSVNHFPIDFLALNLAWAAGLAVKRLPLPSTPLRLRLGNMLTLARVPAQAAAAALSPKQPEAAE